ncbi:hypothetical protein LARV_03650 [Longilinea arvoryzae]|uniref:Uncharacterized protein n=1 Tax=Longilinea arvoryzae TaxID=360412 RepID=A0A0S7BPH0_9CHLR|nr:DUF4405 domain-containing protein [Longilinea arvoryzae]GAP15857.1 hypothetical protein LARV_03650 [Longilinea arvoryzae]
MNGTKRINSNLTNLWMDGIVLAGLLAAFAPNLIGLRLHEWLGLAFGITLWVHILLHWQWVAGVTRRFFTRASWSARFSYLLNVGIFIAFSVIIFSGGMESRYVLQTFGLSASNNRFWEMLHRLGLDLTLWLTALHIGVHWRWIRSWIRKLLRLPRRLRGIEPQLNPAAETVRIDDRA